MSDTANTQLRSIVDRILRVKEREDEVQGAIRAVYAEAAALGYDKTVIGMRVRDERQLAQGWHVYFIAFRKVALLKIGISRDVAQRRRALSVECCDDGELLNCFPGTFPAEGWMHAVFNAWRVGGEWFRLTEETEALARAAVHPFPDRIGTVDKSPAAADRNSVASSAGDTGESANHVSRRSHPSDGEGRSPMKASGNVEAPLEPKPSGGGPLALHSDGSRLHHGTVDATVLLPGVDADGFMVDDIPEQFRRPMQ